LPILHFGREIVYKTTIKPNNMKIKPNNMKTPDLHYKKTGLAVLSSFLLFVSLDAAAQKSVNDVIPGAGSKKEKTTTNGGSGKSVYDVIPGSGPKKPSTTAKSGKSVYDVIPGSGPKKPSTNNPDVYERREHHRHYGYGERRRHLPPGQAKKIYGGSATDYAPGQVKKREGRGDDDRDGDDHHHEKHGKHKHN
jgi:hypothetical protein